MAFPQTPLEVRADLQIGGAWTNVTSDVLVRDGIAITRGRANEASRAGPQECRLTFENRDGRYSSRNPSSPYYGLLGRNTPLRVGVGKPPISATATSAVSSVSLVAPSVTAETAGFLFCTWGAVPVGNITVPGTFSAGTERDGTFSTWGAGAKNIAAGATGTSTATHSVAATGQVGSSVAVPIPAAGSWAGYSTIATGGALATLPIAFAAGDYLLVVNGFSSDPNDDMVRTPAERQNQTPNWILLSDSGPSAGPRVKVWYRRAEVASVSTDLYFTGTSTSDNYARAWVITGAGEYYARFTGEVASWPPTWDLSGVDVRVPVVASGVKRRLSQNSAPLLSALRREMTRTAGIVAYWPLEDGAESTSFGAAVGSASMSLLGTPQPGVDTRFLAADALPTFNGAGAKGVVSYASTSQWAAGALTYLPTGLADEATLFTLGGSGTIKTWTVKYDAGLVGFRVTAYDTAGAVILNTTTGPWTYPALGSTAFLYLTARQSGADIVWAINWVGLTPTLEEPSVSSGGGTIVGQTCGGVTSFQLGAGDVALDQEVVFGHAVVSNSATGLFQSNVFSALVAWVGETPQSRVVRLCAEENLTVAYQAYVQQDDMGAQRPGKLLDLIDQAEDTDGGSITEPRGFVGVQIRPRVGRYGQAAALTLSYTTPGHIADALEPVDDDQATRNDVTVTRIGGGSARAEKTVGPLSTQAPPNGVGRYDVDVPLSLRSDSQAPDQAAWRLHLGTWDEPRWPQVRTLLERVPSLIPTVQALDVGDVVALSNLPAWVPPGPVDLVLEGYAETLSPFSWEWVGNFSPGGPWRVAVTDSSTLGRVDSDFSTLSAGVTSAATSLSVAVAAGSALWITTALNPTQFPFAAQLGGEEVTVTAIVGVASPQTWTVTRAVNGIVKAHAAGAQIRLARPAVIAL